MRFDFSRFDFSRFDFEALRQTLTPHPTTSLATVVAGGSVALATLVVGYGALVGTNDAIPDAVTVSAPTFTPVSHTVPAPTPARRSAHDETEAAPQFEDAVSLTRGVQKELKRAGCYGGPVNGVWNGATRAAMGAFTTRVNARLPIDRPDPVLLALLETHRGTTCAPGGSKETLARAENTPTARMQDAARLTPVALESDAPRATKPDADDLGFPAGGRGAAPNPIASVKANAADADAGSKSEAGETKTASIDGTTAAAASATAAAASTAAVSAPQASKPERQRTSRRYKRQPSLSRQVSKGFRQLQRSLNKLF